MSDSSVRWQQRCYLSRRDEHHSWHWYAHGVDALEGNETVPSPWRGTYINEGGTVRAYDFDPTRGMIDAHEHRANAARGSSYRAHARRAARRGAHG